MWTVAQIYHSNGNGTVKCGIRVQFRVENRRPSISYKFEIQILHFYDLKEITSYEKINMGLFFLGFFYGWGAK